MVMLNIVVAIICAVLLVSFTYKHYGKRGHDCQEGSNRESSGGGNLFKKSNDESWIGELLHYVEEQCEESELRETFSRIHARIIFINRKTAFGRIKEYLKSTTKSNEAYCWGIVYGYCRRKSCEGGCPDELSGILQDGLKEAFNGGFNKGMEIFAPDNNTTSRARFQ